MATFIEIKNIQGYNTLVNIDNIESVTTIGDRFNDNGNTCIQLPHTKVITYLDYTKVVERIKQTKKGGLKLWQ